MAETPYQQWLGKEGVPVAEGYSVDLGSVELRPWARKGGRGALINLIGSEQITGAYCCEVPAGATLHPQRHIFEEVIYGLSGEGVTDFYQPGMPRQAVRWNAGSLFAVPLNAWHQHRNFGTKPARYFAVTLAPLAMNLFQSEKFVFDNEHTFRERYAGECDFFNRGRWVKAQDWAKVHERESWQTSFVQDVAQFFSVPKRENPETWHVGFTVTEVDLFPNILRVQVHRLEAGTYKMAHRHEGGAHILILGGKGYSLIWTEGMPRIKIDWKPGVVFSPPTAWFHQHFNTGREEAYQLVVRYGSHSQRPNRLFDRAWKTAMSLREGGDRINYVDEDPAVRLQFKEELAKEGIDIRMAPADQRHKAKAS